jgi:hypothetical protein
MAQSKCAHFIAVVCLNAPSTLGQKIQPCGGQSWIRMCLRGVILGARSLVYHGLLIDIFYKATAPRV